MDQESKQIEALREELLRTNDLLQQREQEVRVILATQSLPMLLPDARLEVEEVESMLLAAQNKVCASSVPHVCLMCASE